MDDRQQPANTEKPLIWLFAALTHARDLYMADPRNRLEGYREAVAGLLEFLHTEPRFKEANLDLPLMGLGLALRDLDQDILSPLFSVSKKSGRSRRSLARRGIIVTAAGVVDLLVGLGDKLDVAASKVARRLRTLGFTTHTASTVTATTVRNWRNRIRRGAFKDADAELYHELVREGPKRLQEELRSKELAALQLIDDAVKRYFVAP